MENMIYEIVKLFIYNLLQFFMINIKANNYLNTALCEDLGLFNASSVKCAHKVNSRFPLLQRLPWPTDLPAVG